MAFGFPPKYKQTFSPENIETDFFQFFLVEAIEQKKWKIGIVSTDYITAYTGLSFTSWNEEIKITRVENSFQMESQCIGLQYYDWGKNKRNIQKIIKKANDICNHSDDQQKQEIIMKWQSRQSVEDIDQQLPLSERKKLKNFWSYFIPKTNYLATPLLLDINILIFILMTINGINPIHPDSNRMIQWGANYGYATLNGEWWRLFTCCFLHFGLFHLLSNMLCLAYIGIMLEPILGTARIFITYMISGLISSTVSLKMHSMYISAGASGAIFGLFGVFLILLLFKFVSGSARKSLFITVSLFIVLNLIRGITGNVDNAAHIGGLIGGGLTGLAFIPAMRTNDTYGLRNSFTAIFLFATLLGALIVYQTTPNIGNYYQQVMRTFIYQESMALEVLRMPATTPNDELKKEITNRGIYYWNENIALIQNLDQLSLTDALHVKNQRIIDYCKMRILSYQIKYKRITDWSVQLKDSDEYYDNKISEMIDVLKRDYR